MVLNYNSNSFELFSNYLLCKLSDQLLNNKEKERYDPNDFHLIVYLTEVLKSGKEIKYKSKFKVYIAYLIFKFANYFHLNENNTIGEILEDLKSDRILNVLPYDIHQDILTLMCKKANQMVKSEQIAVDSTELSICLNNFLEQNGFYIPLDQTEDYTNQMFYDDVCDFVRKHVYSQNSQSVLLDILKYHDFSNEKEEKDLLNELNWLRKQKLTSRKSISTNPFEEIVNSITKENNITEKSNKPAKKKQRLENVEFNEDENDEKENENIKLQNRSEKTSEIDSNIDFDRSPTIHLQLEVSNSLSNKIDKNSAPMNQANEDDFVEIENLKIVDKPSKNKKILKKIRSKLSLDKKLLESNASDEESDQREAEEDGEDRYRILLEKKKNKSKILESSLSESDQEFLESPNSKSNRLREAIFKTKNSKSNLSSENTLKKDHHQMTSSPKKITMLSTNKPNTSKLTDNFNGKKSFKRTLTVDSEDEEDEDDEIVINKSATSLKNKAESNKKTSSSFDDENHEYCEDEEEKEEEKIDQENNKTKKANKTKQQDSSLDDLSEDVSDTEETSFRSKQFKSKINSINKQRRAWTDEETVYLVVGTKIYGKGSWSKILSEFSKKFNNRNAVSLKDRFRNLERNNEMSKYETQANIIVNALKTAKKKL